MEITLKLEDKKDLMVLWGCLNSVQSQMVHRSAQLTAALKGMDDFPEWHDETIEEWNRIQSVKKQIDMMIKVKQ